MKLTKSLLALLLAFCMVTSLLPGYALAAPAEALRTVQSSITIDENPDGGYEGDYVVIYNPATSKDDARSTGNMAGLIETSIAANTVRNPGKTEDSLCVIDVDAQMEALWRQEGAELTIPDAVEKRDTQNYKVGDTMDFEIYAPYSPTGSGTVEFKCLYVGEHCYIWTPTLDNGVTYPLDTLGEGLAEIAAAEFDSKFDLMQSSFGEHIDFETGDNRLHMLYYNINEGWQPGQGYVAGFFYGTDLMKNLLPILNIDTYPGVIYPNYYGEGEDWVRTDSTYHTMVHEYQHLINFSNNYSKGYMQSWLNESFSAGAEEICYPGSSVVPRVQSWENYFYTDDWLSPPAEFEYQPGFNLHNGYSLYDWDTSMSDVLALYAQVSMFAQYLYSRFGNGIYRQINDAFDTAGNETNAISKATGVDCSELAKEFRVAVTANAALDQYGGIYGFKTQEGYDPAQYHDMENPWNLLGPVVFTGDSCEIKGGGAITVKPVGGVYHPPEDADAGLVYIGVKLAPRPNYTVSFSVGGEVIGSETVPADDSITLPATVSAEIEGWSFIGWAERDVADTTEEPAYLAPGASYKVTAEASLYALFKHTGSGDALYTTSPMTLHTPEFVSAAPPTCTDPGNSAYYHCTVCGKYFSEESCETEITPESTVIPATGHNYQAAVTEPTATEGGYTTWTCSNCGDSYKDSYTDPLGYDYTVTFSVLGDTGVIAPVVCNTLTGITLPEAEAPEGWRFLGWVLQDYDIVTVQPEGILTGAYTAPGDVTLLALFTYNDYGGKPPKLEKMGLDDSFSDGDKIVIVESGGVYGLYQKSHNYAYVSNFEFTADAEAILADELKYFDVTEVEGGWYLGDEVNGWLYTPDNTANLTIRSNTAFMTAFTLTTYDGHLALQHTVPYNDNVFYVNCGTNLSGQLANKWRMVNANSMSGVSTLDIYKLIEGGPAVARYTTMIHTHTPGEPVIENDVAPTCTKPGSYDTVTYCTACGEELGREHTDIAALGHEMAVLETVAPTCTAYGYTVYKCIRCETYYNDDFVDALGHDWGEPEYVWADDNSTVTATRTCKNDAAHVETETVETTVEVIKEATYEAEGEAIYTATFANAAFEPQTKTVATPKLERVNPFVDVKEGQYYYEPVLWAVNATPQITSGTSATTFSPDSTCTRGQVVTFLWRAQGCPEPTSTDNPFTDVKESDYFYKAVLWAKETGVTSGTSATTFSPGNGCTRAQVVTFLWRAEGKPEPASTENPFNDVPAGEYYTEAVLWAVGKGVTTGTGATTFSPGKTCTRGQIVTFLYRDLA